MQCKGTFHSYTFIVIKCMLKWELIKFFIFWGSFTDMEPNSWMTIKLL